MPKGKSKRFAVCSHLEKNIKQGTSVCPGFCTPSSIQPRFPQKKNITLNLINQPLHSARANRPHHKLPLPFSLQKPGDPKHTSSLGSTYNLVNKWGLLWQMTWFPQSPQPKPYGVGLGGVALKRKGNAADLCPELVDTSGTPQCCHGSKRGLYWRV